MPTPAARDHVEAVHADLRAAQAYLRSIDVALDRLDAHRTQALADRDVARQRVQAIRAELDRIEAPTPGAPEQADGSAAGPAVVTAPAVGPDPYATEPLVAPIGPREPGGPRSVGSAGAGRGRRGVPASLLLLGVGAVLLLSAAAVFLAFSWAGLGVAGQVAVLAGATLASAVACALTRRALLRQASETFAWVTAGLLLLDLLGARAFDLLGLGAVPVDVWTVVTAAVLAMIGTGVAMATTPAPLATQTGGAAADPAGRAATGVTRPPLLAGALVAAAATPVALGTLVVTVDRVVGRLESGDLGAALLVGPLDGLLVSGTLACLLALALPTRGPAALVRVSTRITGLVLLVVAAVLAVSAAAVLPWWWPSVGDGDAAGLDAVHAVARRLLVVVALAAALAVVLRVLGGYRWRTGAGAVAAAVTAGLLVSLATVAGLPRDVGLLVTALALVLLALALDRVPSREQDVPALALRRGVTGVVLLLGGIGAVLLAVVTAGALLAPAVTAANGIWTTSSWSTSLVPTPMRPDVMWPVSQWLEVSRSAVTGAATMVLAVLLTARRVDPRSGATAGGQATSRPRADAWAPVRGLVPGGWREDVATAAAVATASAVWWGWLATGTTTDAAPWAVSAVAAVVLVTTAAALTTRRRLQTYRWRLGPLSLLSLQVLVVAWTVHAALATVVADNATRGEGLVSAGLLLLAGAGALLVAVAGTRGGPLHPPVRRPGRALVGTAREGTVAAGVALIALAAAVAVHARPLLFGPTVDAGLAALLLTAVAASALLRLPAWPGARTAVAGLGLLAVLPALGGTSDASTLPDLLPGLLSEGVPGTTGTTGPPGTGGALDRAGLVWLLAALAVAVQALVVSAPRDGRLPLGGSALRHALLPGPLVVAGLAALASVWPLARRLPVDVAALPATVVLLVLACYVATAVGADPGGPRALKPLPRAIGRDVVLPLLLGLAGATLVAAALPLLDPDALDRPLLAWAGVPASGVLAATVVVRRADPALALVRPALRDVVRPLAVAATLLLLLASARPTTGLPAEVETLLVAALGLAVHLLREASGSRLLSGRAAPTAATQRADDSPGGIGGPGEAPTLRDATTVVTAAGLGALGVLAASAGERPLWVAGLTWWLLGVSALAVVVLAPGPLAGPRPARARSRAWWALRTGATAAVLGWVLAAVDLDWASERVTVPVGVVLTLFGLAALRSAPPRGTVRLLGPGLALAVVPSAVLAVVDPTAPRPLVVAVAGSLLVALGAWRRWQAPLLIGALVVVPVAVVQALPFVVSVPQWVYLAAAGVLALSVGVTFERAKQQAQEAGRRWRELR